MQTENDLLTQVKDDMNLKWNKNVVWAKSKFGESGFNDMVVKLLKPELKEKPIEIISATIMMEILKKASQQK